MGSLIYIVIVTENRAHNQPGKTFHPMTQEELISKARYYADRFGKHGAFSAPADVFDEARVVETVLVYLGSQKRDDYVKVLLDRATGEFVTATYHPGSARKREG
jgi:hypothetical protein